MKKIDSNGLKQSEFLASIFEKSYDLSNLSSKNFIRKFVFSIYEKLFSENTIMFEIRSEEQIIASINNNSNDERKGIKYGKDILYWIGYLYSYFSYIYEKPIRLIYKKIKPDELYDMYEAYHTFDIEFAIKRIIEAKSIRFELSFDELLKDYTNIVRTRLKEERKLKRVNR